MARENPISRHARIRKTAPTVRERVEAAKAKEERPVKKRRGVLAKAINPFKKLRLKDRKFIQALGPIFRPVKKVLSWLVPRYFVNSWREVRQVQWPNRKETWRLTLAVFVFAVVFGAMVAGVDKGLDELFKKVVLK